MNKKIVTLCLLAGLICLSSAGFSQTGTPRVTKRQVNQQKRIHEGVKDGDLTRRESVKLKAREAKIQHDKKAAKSDGVVTAREKARLRREENRTSRAIYRQKHDEQVRH